MHGSAAGYQDRSALLLLFPHFCGNMSTPNVPMGIEDTPGGDGTVGGDGTAGAEAVLTTPPAKRRGGVVSLSMGALPRTGITPNSPLTTELTPRQGRSALAGARKRQASATVETNRTLSALPAIADIATGQMLSPGPDATMEELRGFCVTAFDNHDKALAEIVNKLSQPMNVSQLSSRTTTPWSPGPRASTTSWARCRCR